MTTMLILVPPGCFGWWVSLHSVGRLWEVFGKISRVFVGICDQMIVVWGVKMGRLKKPETRLCAVSPAF
jgi:hypothetical protein